MFITEEIMKTSLLNVIQGTIALELLQDVPDLDVILVSASGGGMKSGIAIAAKSINKNIKSNKYQCYIFMRLLYLNNVYVKREKDPKTTLFQT